VPVIVSKERAGVLEISMVASRALLVGGGVGKRIGGIYLLFLFPVRRFGTFGGGCLRRMCGK